ncbi:Hypothetical protein SCLAV_3145 [Streptomyces clavuligerus]|uniref:Uncharacterized protein n=1 Tax=Streptomyces clavuligerus TaxID=1901 RepID=B5GPA8_STRCL|nr:hypothetical protein SSCG_01182 [Streptomyces clavuligerus]EFG08216.1 Hypothetical protein SCLAV_3145 [Streptomyces clavuligerus]
MRSARCATTAGRPGTRPTGTGHPGIDGHPGIGGYPGVDRRTRATGATRSADGVGTTGRTGADGPALPRYLGRGQPGRFRSGRAVRTARAAHGLIPCVPPVTAHRGNPQSSRKPPSAPLTRTPGQRATRATARRTSGGVNHSSGESGEK